MNCLNLDNPYIKTYATEARLLKAMTDAGVDKVRHQIVRTPSGRWTVLIIGFQRQLMGAGFAQIG